MKCEDIANLLDEGEIRRLPPEWQADVEAHLGSCQGCADEWRAVQALRSWRDLPTPSARTDFFAEAIRRATQPRTDRARRNAFWGGAGVGGALAAGIAIAIMVVSPAVQETAESAMPALTIALNEPRDISVAIDSGEALMGAQIRVVLTGGIELDGFADQSVVSWTTDLQRGANRLTLPLVAVRPAGGQVLVEVSHERKRQIFVVDVGIASTARYAPPTTEEPGLAWHPRTAPAVIDRPYFVNSVKPQARFAV